MWIKWQFRKTILRFHNIFPHFISHLHYQFQILNSNKTERNTLQPTESLWCAQLFWLTVEVKPPVFGSLKPVRPDLPTTLLAPNIILLGSCRRSSFYAVQYGVSITSKKSLKLRYLLSLAGSNVLNILHNIYLFYYFSCSFLCHLHSPHPYYLISSTV